MAEADSSATPDVTPQLWHPKYWLTWLAIALAWLLTRCPYRFQLLIGKALGLSLYHLVSERRHVVEVNLKLCFPEKSECERQQLVREVFVNNGIGVIETMLAWFRPADFLTHRTEFIGFEKIATYQQQGRGVMLLGAHYSTLDLAGALVATQLPISVSYRPQNNAVMNYLMEKSRAKSFEQCLTRKDIRGFIRTLRQGKALWYAQDQDFGRTNSVFVNFFGHPAATITATSRIAKASKAVVLPISYFRKPDNSGYIIEIHDELGIPSGDDKQDAQLANDFLETQLRRYPAQYLWLHKRFKTLAEPGVKKGLLYRR